jgi:putative hydrolase of the HAD superfamily
MSGGTPGTPRFGGRPPLEAVLFDAGLTLIQSATPAAAVAGPVLTAQGIPFALPELTRAMDRAEEYLAGTWHSGDWWGAERTVRALFVAAYCHGLPTVAAVGGDTAVARRLAEAIYDSYQDTRHWGLYPDVLPTLTTLRRAGLRMGIISDWGHGLEAIVLELELHGFLEFLVVSSRVGVSKPDPRVFELALGRIGIAAERAVYVGDTYVKDVLGARAAGLTPVLLDRSGRAPPPDCLVVTTLTDLPTLLGVPTAV